MGESRRRWDEVGFECERLLHDGPHLIALGTHGRVTLPGWRSTSPHAQVWTLRDGRVIRMQWFNTNREPLDAAGVEE